MVSPSLTIYMTETKNDVGRNFLAGWDFSGVAAHTGLLLFAVVALWVALKDVLTFTISNKLMIFLVCAYVIIAPLSGIPLEQIGINLGVSFVALVIGFILFARGVIGGGDAKYAAAALLWVGADHALEFMFLTALAGGLLALFIVILRIMPIPSAALRFEWILRLMDRNNGVPYGVALSAAALLVLPVTHWGMQF